MEWEPIVRIYESRLWRRDRAARIHYREILRLR